MSVRRNDSQGRTSSRAFTLIEVLVVVAIIALLISILLPSLARAKEMSRRTICATRLHNIGLGMTNYALSNSGKIIQCRQKKIPIAINPRIATKETLGTTPDYNLVDWQGQAKKYKIDKATWECPNREGLFMYEGRPIYTVQGYTKDQLQSQGYQVEDAEPGTEGFNQWLLGYLYFGGMEKWSIGGFKPTQKAPLPVDLNARGHWALAAEANIWAKDGTEEGWGIKSRRGFRNIPPHPDRSGAPEGGNVLTMDAAVAWIPATRMWMLNDWQGNKTRKCFWWQQELGEELVNYHRALAWKPGIRAGLAQY